MLLIFRNCSFVLFSYADNPFFFSALGKMKYIYRAQSCRLLLFYILFISSFILNVFLLVKEYIFTELDMELDGEFYSGFDPVAISDQISVFNHAKHREVECKYFTPSFNISVDRYPKLSELLKHVNFNRYNQLYNVGVYLIDTVRSNKRLNVLEVSGSNEILKTLLGKGNSFKKISYPEYNVLNLHKRTEFPMKFSTLKNKKGQTGILAIPKITESDSL